MLEHWLELARTVGGQPETTLVLLALAFVCAIFAIWRREGAFALGSLALATGLLTATFFHGTALSRSSHLDAQRQRVRGSLQGIHARLDRAIVADASLLQALHAHIALEPGIDDQRFQALARVLLMNHHRLRNVALAPDLVIQHVHPIEGNTATLGFEYRSSDEQWPSVQDAITSGETVLAGPIDLIQGGRGLVARRAISLHGPDGAVGEGPLWGVAATVIDLDELLRHAGVDRSGRADGLQVAIRGRDGSGPTGDVFLGPETLFDAPMRAVTLPLELPRGSWALAARPVQGWDTSAPNARVLGAGLLSLWVLMIGGWGLRRQLARTEDAGDRIFRTIFTESAVAQALIDVDALTLRDVNLAARSLLDSEDLTDASLLAFSGRSREETARRTLGAWHAGRAEAERRIVLPSGRELALRVVVSALTLADDSRVLHAILEDVTEARDAEQELVRARDAALSASRAKDAFLANMSHEIRTPMNGILGSAQLLLNEELGPQERELVDIVRRSARSLLRILDDILDLAKVREGRLDIMPAATDVRALVDGAVRLVRPQVQPGVHVQIHIDPAVPSWLELDGTRVGQILGNLLSNSAKFTEQGHIRVELRGGGVDALEIAVEDTGIGMSEDQAGRIFEPFEQAESGTTQRYGGTGLGTTISRDLAERMGGDVSVRSELGVGTRFVVRIPAPEAEADPDSNSDEQAEALSHRVLLVEDNPVNARIATLMLERLGLQVDIAGNGVEALQAAADNDLVFMDIRMPTMDGLDATRELRASGYSRPIVALTANVMPEDRARYLDSGFDAVLGKPVQADELASVCERLLRSGGQAA